MKRDADFFDGREPVLLYIAKKLKDALALEAVLTKSNEPAPTMASREPVAAE